MSHDYQPSWDYPVIELSESVDLLPADRIAIEAVIEDVKKGLAPAMGFPEIEVFFAEHLTLTESGDAAVAVYCNGTASRPVVGFDLAAMDETCDEEGLSLVHQFKISIAHELGHAYQESLGLDHEHEDGFDEDDAEEFGRDWADMGEIKLWLLDPDFQSLASQALDHDAAKEISMNDRNVGAGVLTMACSGLAAFFIVRMFLRALANGFSPGRVGAIHAAGTTQYTVFLIACGIGLVFAGILFYMGLRWAVLNKGDRS